MPKICIGAKKNLQQMILGKFDLYIEKNETWSLSFILPINNSKQIEDLNDRIETSRKNGEYTSGFRDR